MVRRRSRAGIVLAVFGAMLIHAQLGAGIWIWDRLHPPEGANDVDVEYVDANEADLDKSQLPQERIQLPPPPDQDLRVPVPKKPSTKKEELAKQIPVQPQKPEEVQIPKPPEEKKPNQPPPPTYHQKMVEQQYEKDEEDNPNAKFLGEKNKHVKEETRATETNLVQESKGEKVASEPNDNKSEEVGGEKQKIAEVDNNKSELGKKAPKVTPHVKEELPQSKPDKRQKSLLSMRDLSPRQHDNVPDQHLPRSEDGMQPVPEHGGAQASRDQEGHKEGKGKNLKLNLTGDDVDKIFGKTEGAPRELSENESSHKAGKWEKRWGAIKSSLENFIPEVKPGNQTELGTRAAPFAAYIARMHRGIHKLWGFGVLEDWDKKSASNPLNDMELWTMIEIVLNGDGTIDKLTIVRPSGFLPFDVAAMDVVMSAGPYPDPPQAIKSANGKIYLHWRFHRDDRACGTFGVDPYVLGTPPEDTINGDTSEIPKSAAHPEGIGQGAGVGGIPMPTPRAAPRMLSRNGGGGGGHRKYDDEHSEPDPAHGQRAAARLANPQDPDARKAAETWFSGYRRGDVAVLASVSAAPFKSGGSVVAKSDSDLVKVYKSLLAEAPSSRDIVRVQMYSSSTVRGVRGGLPASAEEGAAQLFAVGRAGSEEFVLVLARRGESWRVVGLDR
jgi:TonB family protein